MLTPAPEIKWILPCTGVTFSCGVADGCCAITPPRGTSARTSTTSSWRMRGSPEVASRIRVEARAVSGTAIERREGLLQFLAVFRVHRFRAATRCLVRYPVPLRELFQVRISSGQPVRDDRFAERQFSGVVAPVGTQTLS